VRRVLAVSVLAACVREPVEEICPPVGPGDLVISEIRGDQTAAEDIAGGQWIEIYNASSSMVDLYGLHIRLRRVDGSDEDRIIIRRDGVMIGAGGFAVIGLGSDAARLPFMAYGAGTDTGADIFTSAAIDIRGCGDVEIDVTQYTGLTRAGTLSVHGGTPPAADTNDDANPSCEAWCDPIAEVTPPWCIDDVPDIAGVRIGTPGAPNLDCQPCAPCPP
jgi:hypothetical protein